MERLVCVIKIGKYEFDYVNSVSIEEDIDNLTTKCEIVVPRKLIFEGKVISDNFFNIGDSVEVRIGYYDASIAIPTLFKGYIASINNNIPLIFKCEDEMWKFKQTAFSKSYESVDLFTLIKYVQAQSGTSYTVKSSLTSFSLGKFIINNATGAEVFEELRKNYAIYCFFDSDSNLVVDTFSNLQDGNAFTTDFTVQEDFIEDNLEFVNAKESKILIKITNILSGNTKKTYEFGDKGGKTISLFRYNASESELKKYGESQLAKYKKTGLTGSFTTFGEPFVRCREIVNLSDKKLKDRDGRYLIKAVTRNFDLNGYKQEVFLDQKFE